MIFSLLFEIEMHVDHKISSLLSLTVHFISLLTLKLSFAVELLQSTHCRGRVRVNSF